MAPEMLENRVSGDLRRLSHSYLHPEAEAVAAKTRCLPNLYYKTEGRGRETEK